MGKRMALFKKILPKNVTKRKSKDSLGSTSSTSLEAGENDLNKFDLQDLYHTDKAYKENRHDLNEQFVQLRKQERKLAYLQQGILEIEREIQEVKRLMTRVEVEIEAVEEEAKLKLKELEETLQRVNLDAEIEIRRREPMLYKKYSNIKTVSDCKDVVKLARNKAKALQHLELLVYRKYAKLQQSGPISKFDRHRAKYTLLPVKPTRFRDSKFVQSIKPAEGIVFFQIEDEQNCSPQGSDVIDLTENDEIDEDERWPRPFETEV